MEEIIFSGLLILLILLFVIFRRIKDNSIKIEQDIQKLNTKIDSLTHLIKNKHIESNQKEISVFENSSSILEEEKENIPEEHQKEEIQLSGSSPIIQEIKEVENKQIPSPLESESVFSSLLENEKIEEKRIESLIEKPIKKPKTALDLEKLFGENILSKIGITTLVLGIAYFVKYAIDQNWIGEAGRVAIGVFIGLGIIGIAHKLREKYLAFSALLAGGGIAVLYITITLAFRQYELFSQPTAFIILILITIFSILLSLYYNQKILAIFSILGGFTSPLLVSSGTGDYVTLFSYIFILNIGMLVLAYKKKWFVVSLLSYFLTYIFYGVWMTLSYRVENKTGALCFSLLFFVQFYILVVLEYFKIRKINPFQVFVILTNNFFLYITLFYLYDDSPVNLKGGITIAMAAINALPMLLLIRMKEKDSLFFHLLIGIVITFVSLAIPIQLKGSAITMFWGAEATLLLWLFSRSRIEIFKFSFMILEILALSSLFVDYVDYYLNGKEFLRVIINPIFITGTLVIIFLYISLIMLKKERDSKIFLFKNELCSLYGLYRVLNGIFLFLLFILPFSELTYQLNTRAFSNYEIALIQGVYIYLFTVIYAWIRKDKLKKGFYYLGILLSILYSVLYLGYIVSSTIKERFYLDNFSFGVFSLHFLTIPAFILLIIHLVKKNSLHNKERIYWIVSITSVIALSVETDNLVLMRYDESVLGNVHTIVYPVIWGIAALVLIIAGMKYKKVLLRKISLSLFALIILKLYLYDVWKMPQAGRIISFIILGLILLGTSFLYQKLKVLIINEEESKKAEEKE